MIQTERNFRVVRKLFAVFEFHLQNDDGTPAEVLGYDVRMQIRTNPHANPAQTMGTGLGNAGDGDGGYVAFWMSADAAWPSAGKYLYDVIIFPTGFPDLATIVAGGEILITEPITKI